MFTIQYTEWWGRAVVMAKLSPSPTKPIILPWQHGSSGGGKKEEYAMPRTEGREASSWKVGLTTMALTQDLLSGMLLVFKKRTQPPLEQYITWTRKPGQPSAQLSEFIRLTACKKAMHAMSRWYKTVYIPWIVVSYDTHKGKHWLNYDPPNHRGPITITILYII